MTRFGHVYQRLAIGLVVPIVAMVALTCYLATAPTRDKNALLMAAEIGKLARVEELVSRGVDVDSRDTDKSTPLIWATRGDFTDVAEFLISKGANVSVRDVYGHTPLHYTAVMRNSKLTALLIDKGADVNAKNGPGDTPLHWAQAKSVVDLLVNNGADVDAKNKKGITPRRKALDDGKVTVAEVLRLHGAR